MASLVTTAHAVKNDMYKIKYLTNHLNNKRFGYFYWPILFIDFTYYFSIMFFELFVSFWLSFYKGGNFFVLLFATILTVDFYVTF
jgi:hypothetical protein